MGAPDRPRIWPEIAEFRLHYGQIWPRGPSKSTGLVRKLQDFDPRPFGLTAVAAVATKHVAKRIGVAVVFN